MKRDVQQILDECVESILSGASTLEECIFRLDGELRSEVEPMLFTVQRLVKDADVKPNTIKKQIGRDRLLAAVEQKRWESGIEREVLLEKQIGRDPYKLLKYAAIAIGFLMVLSGATVAMADQSLPGSPLYPVKRAVENAKIGLTFNEGKKKLLYMRVAERRMDELESLDGNDRNYPDTIENMMNSIEKATGSPGTKTTVDDAQHNQTQGQTGSQMESRIDSLIEKSVDALEKRSAGTISAKLQHVSPNTRLIIERKLRGLELIAARRAAKKKADKEAKAVKAAKEKEETVENNSKLTIDANENDNVDNSKKKTDGSSKAAIKLLRNSAPESTNDRLVKTGGEIQNKKGDKQTVTTNKQLLPVSGDPKKGNTATCNSKKDNTTKTTSTKEKTKTTTKKTTTTTSDTSKNAKINIDKNQKKTDEPNDKQKKTLEKQKENAHEDKSHIE